VSQGKLQKKRKKRKKPQKMVCPDENIALVFEKKAGKAK